MNIQTTQLKNQRKQIKDHSAWGVYCGFILKVIILLLVVFVIANSYIYFNQQIQTIERDNAAVERKIEAIDRELKKLYNDYETASSYQSVSRQIVRFGLKLREPDYTQIHHITLNESDSSAVEVAGRKDAPAAPNARRVADRDRSRHQR